MSHSFRPCTWRHVFGKPREGIHNAYLGPFAIVDTAATWLLAIVLPSLLPMTASVPTWKRFLWLVLLSIPVHWFFCVDTTLLRTLGVRALPGGK